eukprot:TRINITY_DN13183_c0_g1_i1.p3 TRINITY_DN13183_c0_g1~~TRINITY_DN13183_c0_g1_i1.p3  ORF type:complete len:111 (-),score=39.69 TRINITY_DN13183_c0_g1_i1:135-467(-)
MFMHKGHVMFFFFLMIRRPPRSTQGVSSAASDVYKRQVSTQSTWAEILLEGDSASFEEMLEKYQKDKGSSKDLLPILTKKILNKKHLNNCLLYTSPSPRDLSTSRMPSSA